MDGFLFGSEAFKPIDGRSIADFGRVLRGEFDPLSTLIDVDLGDMDDDECRAKLVSLLGVFPGLPLALVNRQKLEFELKLESMISDSERKTSCIEPIYPVYISREESEGRAHWWTMTPHGRSLVRVQVTRQDVFVLIEGFDGISHFDSGRNLLLYVPKTPNASHLGTPLLRWGKVFDDFLPLLSGSARQRCEFVGTDYLKRSICDRQRHEAPNIDEEWISDDDVIDMAGSDGLNSVRRLLDIQERRYKACRRKTVVLAENAKDLLMELFRSCGKFNPTARNQERLSALVSFSVGAFVNISVLQPAPNVFHIIGKLPGATKGDDVSFEVKVSPGGDNILSAEYLISNLKKFR